MGLFGDAEAEAEQDGFADVSQDNAPQQVRVDVPHLMHDSIACALQSSALSYLQSLSRGMLIVTLSMESFNTEKNMS